MTAARQPISVATAFTAPIKATATAERAASTRTEPRPDVAGDAAPPPHSARMIGSSTHGASIIGSVSDEIDPSVVSTRGDNAKAAALITLELVVPMPRASATRRSPQ